MQENEGKRSLLSVYNTPDILQRSPGSIQSCKIGYLYKNSAGSVFVIAEGEDLFIIRVETQNLESTGNILNNNLKPGQPHRLKPGFQKAAETTKIFSFSSKVHIESISVIEQGEQNWKILVCNGIGEVYYCDASGRKIEICDFASFPTSWAQSIKLTEQNQVSKIKKLLHILLMKSRLLLLTNQGK